jgi:hypothetical protein
MREGGVRGTGWGWAARAGPWILAAALAVGGHAATEEGRGVFRNPLKGVPSAPDPPARPQLQKPVRELKRPTRPPPPLRPTRVVWRKESGDDGGRFAPWNPYDLEVDEARDRLYLSSTASGEVYVLEAATGRLVRVLGGGEEVESPLEAPLGIGLDRGGRLHVADRDRRRVVVFAPEGNRVGEISLDTAAAARNLAPPLPVDVAIHPEDGRVYVADWNNPRVWVLEADGSPVTSWGEWGEAPGQLTITTYLRFDRGGNLLLTNWTVLRIDTFTPGGAHLLSWGGRGVFANDFLNLGGVALLPELGILVADPGRRLLTVFTLDGIPRHRLGDEEGRLPRDVGMPRAVAADSRGRIFVADGEGGGVWALER